MSEEIKDENLGAFSEEELSSIIEESPELEEAPEPTMSEEDQALIDAINDVELLELEETPQWKDPEPFMYVHPGEPESDVIGSPEHTGEPVAQPTLGYDSNGVLGSTTVVPEAPKAEEDSANKSEKIAIYSTRNASWGDFGKVYIGYNILSKKAADAWLTRDHCRIATPEEVAKEFGN